MPDPQKTPSQAHFVDLIHEYYENNLRDMVDNRPEKVREQVAVAMKSAPANASDVEKWFADHFRKPPLSHDTVLYSRLHEAKEHFKSAKFSTPVA